MSCGRIFTNLLHELRTNLHECGLPNTEAMLIAQQMLRDVVPRVIDDTFAVFVSTTSRSSSEVSGQLVTNGGVASPGAVGGGAS
jgi:hypothetical protein